MIKETNELESLARHIWPLMAEKYNTDNPRQVILLADKRFKDLLRSAGARNYQLYRPLSRAADIIIAATLAHAKEPINNYQYPELKPYDEILTIVSKSLHVSERKLLKAAETKALLISQEKGEHIMACMKAILDECDECHMLRGSQPSVCNECWMERIRKYDLWQFWRLMGNGKLENCQPTCRHCGGDLGATTDNLIYCVKNNCDEPVKYIKHRGEK